MLFEFYILSVGEIVMPDTGRAQNSFAFWSHFVTFGESYYLFNSFYFIPMTFLLVTCPKDVGGDLVVILLRVYFFLDFE